MLPQSTTEIPWIAALLHFSDSALPVGAYAHSFGLEGLCQDGVIHDADSLRTHLLRDVQRSLLTTDLPLMARVHSASLDCDAKSVRHWDEVARALRPTRALREAASRVGRQQWKVFEQTWQDSDGHARREWFDTQQSPVVTSVILAELGVPLEGCLWSGAYQCYSALTQSALKLLSLGPSATQRILAEALSKLAPLLPAVVRQPDHELGFTNPLWDIASSRHEGARARLFLS